MDVVVPLVESQAIALDWETELVLRARRDKRAFGELYRRHYAAVAAYVYRRVGDRHCAEDIVAEVFLAAMKALPTYQPRGLPIRAWFYRIATHAVHRWWRRQRRWSWLIGAASEVGEPCTSQDAETDPSFSAAVAALRRVSPKLQAVLALHYCEGLSVEEVAQVLSCRVGTVKSRLSRGREALREAMRPRS